MTTRGTVRFYWSLRSPYTWLAVHRMPAMLSPLPVDVEWIALYPRAGGASSGNPARLSYLLEDVGRFAAALGLEFRHPEAIEADWPRAHAMFFHAADRGCGQEWAREALDARWTRGEDLGSEDVLAEIARRVGLHPREALDAFWEPEIRQRHDDGFAAATRDAVFGVPTFVFRGQRFWGNDRLEWLVRAIEARTA